MPRPLLVSCPCAAAHWQACYRSSHWLFAHRVRGEFSTRRWLVVREGRSRERGAAEVDLRSRLQTQPFWPLGRRPREEPHSSLCSRCSSGGSLDLLPTRGECGCRPYATDRSQTTRRGCSTGSSAGLSARLVRLGPRSCCCLSPRRLGPQGFWERTHESRLPLEPQHAGIRAPVSGAPISLLTPMVCAMAANGPSPRTRGAGPRSRLPSRP